MKLRSNSGFTIAELLIGMSIAAIASIIMFNMLSSGQRSYRANHQATLNQSDSRVIMGLIAREIRSSGSELYRIPGTYPIATAGLGELRLQSDLNGDGVLNIGEPAENVYYSYSSDTKELYRDAGFGSMLVQKNLQSFSLEYRNSQGTILAALPLSVSDLSQVRSVRIQMAIGTDGGRVQQFDRFVSIRNDPPDIN